MFHITLNSTAGEFAHWLKVSSEQRAGTSGTAVEMTAKRFQRYYKKAKIFFGIWACLRKERKKKPCVGGLEKERCICEIRVRKGGSLFMPGQSA